MQFIKEFKDLSSKDVEIAGGKGASLGEMTQAGIPVPNGYVILSGAFEKFIDEGNLSVTIDAELDKINHEDINSIEKASKMIQDTILKTEISPDIINPIKEEFEKLGSKFVAVRSSATSEDSADAAWAGQLDSFLNTTKETLLENVRKCWASLFTPRAIFYRFEKKLHEEKVSVAVVIQKMINSEESGIAFSVHPVTQDKNQIIIEAGFGLGEAIVSGQITPDAYVIDKQDLHIIDINVNEQGRGLYRLPKGGNEWKELGENGEKQVLSEKEIVELSKLIIKIENHYNFPVDIEWAKEKGKFYIVQSRPITTLRNSLEKNTDDTQPKPEDYVRMFAGKSFVYLLTDIFLQHYNSLGVLSIQDGESWMCFLPITSEKQTLTEGSELYTSKEKFDEYHDEFKSYIKNSKEYFKKIISKEKVTVEECEKFLSLVSKHFSLYSKTEFFYTDSINQEKMVISIEEFDKLKLMGRAHLNKLLFEEKGYLRTFIKKIAKQSGITEEELLRYNIKEIIKVIQDGARVNNDLIKKRDVFFISKDITLWSNKSRELVDKFLKTYREISDKIYGTIANKGTAKGKARVLIPDFKDFDKITEEVKRMKKGEILITETTSPEIIQACKKAAAIVTNQGGMLSHAAIISRELNIPCIIGTDKDIVLNIKTGDELEIDANNGIVKIIKPEPKELYVFHTSVSGFPLLMLELIFNNNTYGKVDYVMLYEKDISLWYLTEKGNKEAYELSKKLIDNNFFRKLFNESEKMDDFLKTYKSTPLSEKNIIKEWKSYVKLFHRFTKIYRFYEPPFQQAIEELILKEISEKEIREYLVSHDQKIIENLSKEGKEVLDKLLKLADMKLILHEESAKFVSEHLMSFIEFVAKKNNISAEIVSSLREKEFVDAMNGKPIDIDLAKERMKGCALVKRNNTWHFDSGDKYLDLKKEIKKTQSKDISGNTAFPGKVKGKVVVYQSWTDTIELNEGDILVTGMTNPLMVPFIKKAGAIVTDEGGIICHAAIISREMKKPCITGTKNATQLLKDGDFVEVDANKGIVRIIE